MTKKKKWVNDTIIPTPYYAHIDGDFFQEIQTMQELKDYNQLKHLHLKRNTTK